MKAFKSNRFHCYTKSVDAYEGRVFTDRVVALFDCVICNHGLADVTVHEFFDAMGRFHTEAIAFTCRRCGNILMPPDDEGDEYWWSATLGMRVKRAKYLSC